MGSKVFEEGGKCRTDTTLMEHLPNREVESQRVPIRQLNASHPLAEDKQRVRHLEREEAPVGSFSLVLGIGFGGIVEDGIGGGDGIGGRDSPIVGDKVAVRVRFQD